MSLRFIFTRLAFAFALAAGLFVSPPSAHAQNIVEKLVQPGPLSEAHQAEDIVCKSCHASFDKGSQPNLCLECHEDVARDVKVERGFHGKSPDVKGVPCKTCHSEHHGAESQIISFDQESFDHALTDYLLAGAHKKVECKACHIESKKYREAPLQCVDCHKSDEPHQGNLGAKCQSCHVADDWKEVSFDHSMTEFPLLGKHVEATCKACHVNEVYKDLPSDCIDCHKEDDAHKGAFGSDCESCHQPASWKQIRFNHGRETGFALIGKHAALECGACHRKTLKEPKLKPDCIACHRKDDTHEGRNGPDCGDCHNARDWKQTLFDHDRNTKFSLRGAHREVDCDSCHIEPVDVSLPGKACIDCHRDDDPHEGSQGVDCGSCHNETDWSKVASFDHEFTRFPLLGAHGDVDCASCHETKKFDEAPVDCISCHEEDDAHKGALGADCGLCHNPNDWNLWLFDHDLQTEFALTGKHNGLECAACHRPGGRRASEQSSECVACHRADDKHRGQYGGDCARCHTTDSFKTVRLNGK